jgi:hypothetical protein
MNTSKVITFFRDITLRMSHSDKGYKLVIPNYVIEQYEFLKFNPETVKLQIEENQVILHLTKCQDPKMK